MVARDPFIATVISRKSGGNLSVMSANSKPRAKILASPAPLAAMIAKKV